LLIVQTLGSLGHVRKKESEKIKIYSRMRGGLWPFVAWLLALKIFCFWFDLKNPAKPFEVYRYWVVVV